MKKPEIRLAYRVDPEGEFWHVYVAKMDTMEGAKLIATISMNIVLQEDLKERFMALMQESMDRELERIVGRRPDRHDIFKAPESDRLKKPS